MSHPDHARHRSRRAAPRSVVLAGALCPLVLLVVLHASAGSPPAEHAWTGPAGPAVIVGADDGPAFEARAGSMEFSGRLLVRPLPVSVRQARGAVPEVAERADNRARARLAAFGIRSHNAGADLYSVHVPPGEDETTFARLLEATGDYDLIHPDWICFPAGIEPNDPQYGQQWHHPVIGAPQAWSISTGHPHLIGAVVDTGIDLAHPDLAPRLVSGYNAASRVPQALGGNVSDLTGHGTQVAGTLGATGNNATGVAGAGWQLSIMPIRATNQSSGNASMSDILHGAEWAALNSAKVISASYTGVQAPAVGATGSYIASLGGVFLFAADNNNQNHGGFSWPDVIVVGATNQSDVKAGFSSYGPGVDVFAPGVDIRTTSLGGGYSWATGTSFATPLVNGVICVLRSINPTLQPAQLRDILYQTCVDLGAPGHDPVYSHGRVDFAAAAALVHATTGPQPPTCRDDLSGTVAGAAVRIDVLANDTDVNGDPIEILSFDGGTVHGGSVARLAGAGAGGRDELEYTPAAGFTGTDSFTYVGTDPGGLTDAATVVVEVFDPAGVRAQDPPAASAPGVRGAYYALTDPVVLPDFDLLTPYAEQVVPLINYPSTNGNFAGSGRADEVGAVFRGYLAVPVTGTYTLFTESDDGSRLWIGDAMVVDNDGLHAMVEQSGSITLEAGLHAVRVDFFERFGGAGLIVRLQGGGLAKQVVPASAWYHAVAPPCPADIDGNGEVEFTDALLLLAAWGTCPSSTCPADIDGDGAVTFLDLLGVLAQWGPCPGAP